MKEQRCSFFIVKNLNIRYNMGVKEGEGL